MKRKKKFHLVRAVYLLKNQIILFSPNPKETFQISFVRKKKKKKNKLKLDSKIENINASQLQSHYWNNLIDCVITVFVIVRNFKEFYKTVKALFFSMNLKKIEVLHIFKLLRSSCSSMRLRMKYKNSL